MKAEPLFQRALTIREKALGPDHPSVAENCRLLANVYVRKGDYVKAEPLFQRALTIHEKALGSDPSSVAATLNDFANLYIVKGDYAKAEPLYQRALAIWEKVLGPNHDVIGLVLNNLATVYLSKGDYTKAEPLFQRALPISEKALGSEHPRVAESLNNLAILYRNKGDYAKAEPLYQRALAVFEKALGPDHHNVAASLNTLALLYRDKGDYARAISHQSRAVFISERNVARNIATGSERQKLAYLATLSEEFDVTIALHARYMTDDLPALRLALTTALQRKGRPLDAMADSIAALRRRLDPQDQALLDQLTDARARQAKLVLDGPGDKKPADHQADIKQLEEEVERLEDQISRRSAEFRAQSQTVTIETVQAAIPPDAVLVEFAAYRSSDPKQPKTAKQAVETRYAAYLLRKQGEPQWVDLGAAKAIDNAVAALRTALRDPRRSDVRQRARTVDEKVMRPVRRLLGQTRRVLLAPDGSLNLVPFAALVDDRGRYLVSRYSFTYLTSGRDLLRLQEQRPATRGALVVADPDFGGRAAASASPDSGGRRSVDFAQAYFTPLPGTQEEAQALRNILPDARVLTGPEATEAAVKQVAAPPVLHLATHGFFLEDVYFGSVPEAGRGLVQVRGQAKELENPLLRSGLAFAGANSRKSGEDDGILTALETAGLNLWGTKLVVLSACDTGVGEVRNGNGVFGLRRALVLAGSESQVMSLWPVSDTATRDLMIAYYQGLQAGQGRTEALRRVQLKMLASGNRRHPYYWASFIQSGEWASLDGARR